MVLTFVGEVDSVRKIQKDFIAKVLEERGYKDCEAIIEPVGKAGDNYIANVKRIVVRKNGEDFKMIAKLAPDNAIVREIASMKNVFFNEHVIYTILFPKYKELQRNAGVPEEEWFKHPECYGTLCDEPNEVILLEDLSGYSILDRFTPMTNECVKMVLKSFAVLHSLSYVLKYKEAETFKEIAGSFFDVHQTPDHLFQMRNQFMIQLESQALSCMDNEEYKHCLRGTVKNLHKLATDLRERETGSKFSVIQQGDGWTNNIMFKFKDQTPLQCILIDYQMTKESTPVYDIMYMLFNSTDVEQRIAKYEEYIDYYYNELNKSLNRYGLQAEEVYPREQLNSDMKRYAKMVLAISVLVANLMTKDIADATDFQDTLKESTDISDTMSAAMRHSNKGLFKNKLQGIIKSMIELGLF